MGTIKALPCGRSALVIIGLNRLMPVAIRKLRLSLGMAHILPSRMRSGSVTAEADGKDKKGQENAHTHKYSVGSVN